MPAASARGWVMGVAAFALLAIGYGLALRFVEDTRRAAVDAALPAARVEARRAVEELVPEAPAGAIRDQRTGLTPDGRWFVQYGYEVLRVAPRYYTLNFLCEGPARTVPAVPVASSYGPAAARFGGAQQPGAYVGRLEFDRPGGCDRGQFLMTIYWSETHPDGTVTSHSAVYVKAPFDFGPAR